MPCYLARYHCNACTRLNRAQPEPENATLFVTRNAWPAQEKVKLKSRHISQSLILRVNFWIILGRPLLWINSSEGFMNIILLGYFWEIIVICWLNVVWGNSFINLNYENQWDAIKNIMISFASRCTKKLIRRKNIRWIDIV